MAGKVDGMADHEKLWTQATKKNLGHILWAARLLVESFKLSSKV